MSAKKSETKAASTKLDACLCGGSDYLHCCAAFIDQGDVPQTAVQLMRSRYTAYVLRNEAYLRATWDERTLPDTPLIAPDENIKWLGLAIVNQSENGDEATVEFIARYKSNGRAHKLHELSRFTRYTGRWFYIDGIFPKD